MKKRKRAPGGGRKAIAASEVLAPRSIRMKNDMWEQLQAAARGNRTKVSREVVRRIEESFSQERKKIFDKDSHLNDVLFLIGKAAREVIGVWDNRRPRYSWRTDRFFFLAFKKAVADLFDALDPGGKCQPPSNDEINRQPISAISPEFVQSFGSPERRGKYVAKALLHHLFNADPTADFDFIDALPDGAATRGLIETENYRLVSARNRLFPGGKS